MYAETFFESSVSGASVYQFASGLFLIVIEIEEEDNDGDEHEDDDDDDDDDRQPIRC